MKDLKQKYLKGLSHQLILQQRWSFPLRISLVNVTKSVLLYNFLKTGPKTISTLLRLKIVEEIVDW